MIVSINGYWKDDNVSFTDYLVSTEYNDQDALQDDDIFFEGMPLEDIKLSNIDDEYEFIVTSFEILN